MHFVGPLLTVPSLTPPPMLPDAAATLCSLEIADISITGTRKLAASEQYIDESASEACRRAQELLSFRNTGVRKVRPCGPSST